MISGKKRAALGAVAAAVLALVGCSEGMTSPRVRPTTAKMAISAAISAQSATKALVVVLYASQNTEGVPSTSYGDTTLSVGLLGAQVVDLADSSNSIQMSIDLASCLNDPKVKLAQLSRQAPADQCPYVFVEAFLLAPNVSAPVRTVADLDSLWVTFYGQYNDTSAVRSFPILDATATYGFPVSTGETATPEQQLVLSEVRDIIISQYPPTLTTGQSVTLTATPVDITGTPISGRTIAWLSEDPKVATVSSTGTITAVGVGSTYIEASSGGRTTFVYVVVQSPPIP